MKFVQVWWQARLPRERVLLSCLAVMLFGGLFQMSLQQAITFKDTARQQLRQEHQALRVLPELERALQERRAARPLRKVAPDIETLNGLAQQAGMLMRLTQQGEIWSLHAAVDVDFRRLIAFLTMLESEYGLTADRLQLERNRQHVRLTHLELVHVK